MESPNDNIFYKHPIYSMELPADMIRQLEERNILVPLIQEIHDKLKDRPLTYTVRVGDNRESIDIEVDLYEAVQGLLDELVICLHGDEVWDHEWETLRNAGWEYTEE